MTEERRLDYPRLGERMTALEVEQRGMRDDVSELKKDMKCLLAFVNQGKGGWKTLVLFGGIAGAVGALVGKFLPFFTVK